MRQGLVQSNPFECVATAAIATSNRAYISGAEAKAVLRKIAERRSEKAA
ncbi:MAG: hypothetical protein PHU85_11390 [Phycisphaerae bacterium]|nr:hypothetical protein [Phycisphaerae bacterium]